MTYYAGNTYNLRRRFSVPDSSPVQYIEPTSMEITVVNSRDIDVAGSPITITNPATYKVAGTYWYEIPFTFPERENFLKIYWKGIYATKPFEFVETISNIKT